MGAHRSCGQLAVFLLWREIFITTGNKDTVVCLAGARSLLRPEKKRYSRLLAGNWQFFCRGGKFSLRPEKKDTLRPEKKDTVVCLMGARAGDYDRKKKSSSRH